MMYLSKFLNFISFKLKEPDAINHTHGVFVDIKGKGVLIIGKSGVGKSEVALDLIYKGHRLIADDSVSFYKRNQNTLIGKPPSLLKNLMEVRGLGIIDIKKLFGRQSVLSEKKLFLVIELKAFQKEIDCSKLEMTLNSFRLFDINIPKIEIPITKTRHASLLIETAVKNYILLQKGSNTINHLSEKLNLQLSLDH
jgi:HPr kinase/phosphorylase